LKELGVVNRSVDVLTKQDLVFFAVTELVVAMTSQLKDVLWQLIRHLSLASLFELISALEPEMDFLEHFMDAVTVLIHENLVKRPHRLLPADLT